MMTYDDFRTSLDNETAPPGLDPALHALWEDGRGNWDAAHQLIQDESTTEAAWVHAYLHRKEGDLANAGYWYRRSGKPVCADALGAEWDRIVRALTD